MSKSKMHGSPCDAQERYWRHFERNNGVCCSIEIQASIVSAKTDFQHVEILQSSGYGALVVCDGWLQSSEFDEFIYHESLVHPALCSISGPTNVLIGGGGEGATLREVLKHPSVERATMVDIDRDFVHICEKHIPQIHQGSFKDKRARIEFDDIASYLENTHEQFDAIILDLNAPSEGGNSFGLYSSEFYSLVKSRLNPYGVVATYALSAQPKSNSDFLMIQGSFVEVFGRCEGLTAKLPLDGDWCGCVIGFGSEQAYNQSIFSDPSRVISEIKTRSLLSRLKYFGPNSFNELTCQPKWVLDAKIETLESLAMSDLHLGSERNRFPAGIDQNK